MEVNLNLDGTIVYILEAFPLNFCFNHIVFFILHEYNESCKFHVKSHIM